MAMLLEFLERAFEIKGAGWIMLLLMTSVTAFMVFAWVEHWPFRLITAPSLFFGAVLANALMLDFGLFITTDASTNQAVGFGIGIVVVIMVISCVTWAYYEMKAS